MNNNNAVRLGEVPFMFESMRICLPVRVVAAIERIARITASVLAPATAEVKSVPSGECPWF